jgi:hypothetical protein
MRHISLCSVAVFLFFMMLGVQTTQAQDLLAAFDGQWIRGALKAKNGFTSEGNHTYGVPQKMKNDTANSYVCMEVNPEEPYAANLYVYNKDGVYQNFHGRLYWSFGTNNDFVGYLEMFSTDGFETDESYVYVKDGRFQSINGIGLYSAPTQYSTYNFIFIGKIVRNPPFEGVSCGWGADGGL